MPQLPCKRHPGWRLRGSSIVLPSRRMIDRGSSHVHEVPLHLWFFMWPAQ